MTVVPRTIGLTAIAAATLFAAGISLTTTTNTPAHAAACLSSHSHWGRMADTRMHARLNAYDGMSWKVANRLPNAKSIARAVSIRQCKWRTSSGAWQCQARVTVNNCV